MQLPQLQFFSPQIQQWCYGNRATFTADNLFIYVSEGLTAILNCRESQFFLSSTSAGKGKPTSLAFAIIKIPLAYTQ